MEEDIKEIKSDIKDVLSILNGNGKVGLCAKVNILWCVGLFVLTTVIIQSIILIRGLLFN